MSAKPARKRLTYFHVDHVGGSQSSQPGRGGGDQGQIAATQQSAPSAAGPSKPPSAGPAPVTHPSPALADSDHSGDASNDEDEDSDDNWLSASNLNAHVPQGGAPPQVVSPLQSGLAERNEVLREDLPARPVIPSPIISEVDHKS